MPITLGSNIASLMAQRELGRATGSLAKLSERLSSGLRINHASDDAAGLAVASTLTAEGRVFDQARRNVNDGISLLNVADSAVGQLSQITTRLRELATQSANGILGVQQRTALQAEADALTNEYNRIVATTKFNDRAVLDSTEGPVVIQAELGNQSTLAIDVAGALAAQSDPQSGSLSYFAAPSSTGYMNLDFVGMSYVTFATVNFLAGASYSSGDVIRFSTNYSGTNRDYYLWFKINGAGSDPGGAGQGACISITSGDSANTVASAAKTAVDTLNHGDFTSYSGGTTFGLGFTYRGSRYSGSGVRSTTIYSGGGLNITSGQGFTVPGWNHSFWYSVGGGGSGTGTRIDLTSSDTDAQIAQKTATAIGSAGGSSSYIGGYTRVDYISYVTAGFAAADPTINGSFALTYHQHGTDDNPDPAANTLTYAGHGLQTGYQLTMTSSGGMPGGLSSGTTYYVIKQDADRFKLATSLANALSGTAMDITSVGSGLLSMNWSGGSVPTAYLTSPNISTAAGARSALDTVTTLSDHLGQVRATIGSAQSRMGVMLSTLSARYENTVAAAARIMDVDVAYESANLVRQQILQQAGAAVLAQANQLPALALKLLQ